MKPQQDVVNLLKLDNFYNVSTAFLFILDLFCMFIYIPHVLDKTEKNVERRKKKFCSKALKCFMVSPLQNRPVFCQKCPKKS